MGRLVVTMFSSLDGVMQGPGGPGEDTSGGFEQSGWQAPFEDDVSGQLVLDQILAQDALLLGRVTYDIWVNYWPQATDAIGEHFNRIPKFVASRTLTDPEWAGTTVVRDVATEVAALKDAHTEIRLWGSGELLRDLLALELVDRIDIFTYPVVLGAGKRVFRDGSLPTSFELVGEAQTFTSGIVLASYAPAGRPEYRDVTP